ncbi:hypothetical protein [Lewinella sp. 4G2]|uniref:hypothetical protein n=1 Tax=Lewinella sp. 4G2 TaxID=1803372 RepID=UPI0007B4E2DE|nr:hypothetical protein [Lewinella sp. 4G2]OAV43777.1 hypothetical protein A3850_004370 [Lewinella sp. 4G2]
MLTFFRSTQAYAGLPFLLYALALQLPVFFGGAAVPTEATTGHGIFGNYLSNYAVAHPWQAVALPVVLMGILALQASVLSNRHNLTRSATQLAALGVLLAWGLTPGFRILHPAMLANIFLLFALLSVGKVYKNQYPQIALFNAGAWLALASILAPGYLLFFLPLYIAGGVLGRTGLAELLRLLTGVFVLYFLVGTFAYFYGFLPEFLAAQTPLFSYDLIPAAPLPLAFAGVLAVLALLLITQLNNIVRVINIEGNKGVTILFWVLLFTPLVILFGGGISITSTATLIVPVGILLGLALHNLPERAAELAHLLLAVGALLVAALGFLQ